MRPVVLTIAGSDPSGGAGIQADIKTIEANGGYAAAVVAALTAQNTRGVQRTMALADDWIAAQLDSVFDDLPVQTVKTGMLGSAGAVGVVASALRAASVSRLVCDPVLRSTSDHALLDEEAVDRLVRELFPLATLITPNRAEAERLAGISVSCLDDAAEAGRRLLESGAGAVLITGGHFRDRPGCDLLVRPPGEELFQGEPIDAPHTHGTGCVFSAAIATGLARGRGLVESIDEARSFVRGAIRHGLPLGAGTGPVDPFHDGGSGNGR
jgi:hydroxymethylpyrimidine/phosphomethylpyrimidine kinase